MSEQEKWEDIPGYEGLYKISDTGNVWSCKYKKLLSKRINKGYVYVNLHQNRQQKTFPVHRLVALVYVPNPFDKKEVNHIDENKDNNNATNLEWVTSKENANHGTRNIRISAYVKSHPANASKRVAQIDKMSGDIIAIYKSTTEASKVNGFHQGNICWCCNGKRNEANGYRWRYIESDIYSESA